MSFFRRSRVEEVKELYGLPLEKGEAVLMYLGYSGIVLRAVDKAIAFDVADLLKSEEIEAIEKLDALLFTHDHSDHYRSKEAAEIFEATKAHVVAEPRVSQDLEGKISPDKLTRADPGETYGIDEFQVSVLSGIHRGPINLYHVKIDELSVFHGGDSGYVPVKDYPADLAFLPTGAPSPTASPEFALKMVVELKPKTVVTIHGTGAQHEELQRKTGEKLPETNVVIPKRYSPLKIKL
ncbi:MAG: MBL fold metallo-hydrolase [Candidatus Bathyarchaeia archaeon]